MGTPDTALSIIDTTGQKLVLQINLSYWKRQELCPLCHDFRWKKCNKNQPHQKIYDTYVQRADMKFGATSLPLCYSCWDFLKAYNKCYKCQVPLGLDFGKRMNFGILALSVTTVFEKDDVNDGFCIACCTPETDTE